MRSRFRCHFQRWGAAEQVYDSTLSTALEKMSRRGVASAPQTGQVLRSIGIGILVICALGSPAATLAQTPTQDSVKVLRRDLDSLNRELAKIDSLKGRFQKAYQAAYHPTRWYAGALASGVIANGVLHIDPDPGGYVDSWGTPDKWQHFSVGAFLVDRATQLRVPLRYSVPLTCAAAVGFEYSQGYASWKDAVAGCSGAAFSGAMRWAVRHYPRDQNRETVHTWTR